KDDASTARMKARVDRQRAKVATKRAKKEAAARKEIGETTLAALPNVDEKLRSQIISALVPTLSLVALQLLVHEGLLKAAKADAEMAARAEAKLAKKKPVGGSDAANDTPVTSA
ncbi:hypothetical protein BD830_1041, partial [Maritimibacter alkaliphilus HTCC2654]